MSQDNSHLRFVTKGDLTGDGPVLVLGIVYDPTRIDTDQNAMTFEEIEKMAYNFVASGRLSEIDLMHDGRPTGSKVVDSTIIRWENPYFPVGAWVLGTLIYDSVLKADIQAGKFNGYSLEGTAFETTKYVIAQHPIKSEGTTEPSTEPEYPEHVHELTLKYDRFSNIIPAYTSEVLGHRHLMSKGTATEMADGHAHRVIIEAAPNDVDAVAQLLAA